jgi:serine protease
MSVIRSLTVVILLISGSLFAAPITPSGNSVPGEVLVKLQIGASSDEVASLEHGADIDHGDRISKLHSGEIWRMHSRSQKIDALITALQHNPKVVYAEPNYIVHMGVTPNDTSYSLLWGMNNTGQSIGGSFGSAGADIRAEAAWGVTTGSASIVVGVVDTGIDYNHPDLAANVWSNPGGKGNVACAAGTHGFNAITMTCDPMDDHYHGTHVSGTIGAVGNNSLGVVGVNWTTSIMGLKFLNSSGSGTTAGAIAAIDFAVQAKIDGVNVRVLSNSWGGSAFSKALLDEINKAGENDILFVAAAGNDSSSNDYYPHYPANYGTPNLISVAATDNRDNIAYFSDYGLTTVHLGAPGVSVYSTMPGGNYGYLSGTSMAAPHVSGVAALVLAMATEKPTSPWQTTDQPMSRYSSVRATGRSRRRSITRPVPVRSG